MVENSGANQRRSNRSSTPQRTGRPTRSNQTSRTSSASRAGQSNRTDKAKRTGDANRSSSSKYSNRFERTEKSGTARDSRSRTADDRKRGFENKSRTNDKNRSKDSVSSRKSSLHSSRDQRNPRSGSVVRSSSSRTSRETGYQVRSTADRNRNPTGERNTERRSSTARSSYRSGDGKPNGLRNSESNSRTARPARSHIDRPDRRTTTTGGPRPDRGGRGRDNRDERTQKFDLPRRFRGDLPRRERDQRARGNAPVIDQDITGDELGEELIAELKTLPTGLTISVAQHLVMTQRYLEIDPKLALAHAIHAKELAGRFPIVREIVGVAHYVNENWQEALNDFRAVKRMASAEHLVPMMADCERGLGRPERAIAMLAENRNLAGVIGIEAAIVEAGARSDLGQHEAALVALKIPALTGFPADQTAYARLCFAYGSTLMEMKRIEEAQTWFQRADQADPGATAAAEFLTSSAETIYLDDLDADS